MNLIFVWLLWVSEIPVVSRYPVNYVTLLDSRHCIVSLIADLVVVLLMQVVYYFKIRYLIIFILSHHIHIAS